MRTFPSLRRTGQRTIKAFLNTSSKRKKNTVAWQFTQFMNVQSPLDGYIYITCVQVMELSEEARFFTFFSYKNWSKHSLPTSNLFSLKKFHFIQHLYSILMEYIANRIIYETSTALLFRHATSHWIFDTFVVWKHNQSIFWHLYFKYLSVYCVDWTSSPSYFDHLCPQLSFKYLWRWFDKDLLNLE